jgi:2-amino-4-hydroxy-6-hydroxymethyldihydropteridine diphosphokinase
VVRAAVALGSNVGDRLSHLRAGVEGIRRAGAVQAVSPLFETEPVGGPEQGRYLNAVVVIDTALGPEELLSLLLEVEREQGRVRDVRWGPRTLDLDIVAMEGVTVDADDLHVPHRRAHERGFVAVPLARVWPDARLADGSAAADAAGRAGTAGLFEWSGDWTRDMPHLGSRAGRWVAGQIVVFVVYAAVLVATGEVGSGPGLWTGASIAAAGVGLGGWAVAALGRNLSPFPQPLPTAELVDRGPYRLVRHPLYGAIVIGMAGVAVAMGSWAAVGVSAGLGVFFRLKAEVEERALVVNLPGYSEYRARVRRCMVPFVW